jgi:putative transposase
MKRRHHSPEQIIRKLREAERMLGEGRQIPEVAKELGISEATFHRWRNQYGGMKADDVKRLKELERENAQLKAIVADQALENRALKEVRSGCPSIPDLVAFVAFEAAAAQAVAAFEVTDPSLHPGAVASSAAAGAPRAFLLAAGDVDGVGQVLERGVGRGRRERAVYHDLLELDAEVAQLLGGGGQQRVLGRIPDLALGRQDEPARALLRVRGDLAELIDVAKFGRLSGYPDSRPCADSATIPRRGFARVRCVLICLGFLG